MYNTIELIHTIGAQVEIIPSGLGLIVVKTQDKQTMRISLLLQRHSTGQMNPHRNGMLCWALSLSGDRGLWIPHGPVVQVSFHFKKRRREGKGIRKAPELRRVEEPQSGMIDDAALQVGIVVVSLEHEEFSTASSVHWVTRLGWECETLLHNNKKQEFEFLVNQRNANKRTNEKEITTTCTSELAVQATTTLLQLKNSGGIEG